MMKYIRFLFGGRTQLCKPMKNSISNFTPFRISNASVADEVGNHKSASPFSLKPAFSVGECRHHNYVGVSNEKRCKYIIVSELEVYLLLLLVRLPCR